MPKIKIKNESTISIHGLKPGATLAIEVDGKGTPTDRHWRRRLRDSRIDQAISVVVEKVKEKKPSIKEKED